MANNFAAAMPVLVAKGLQYLRSACVMPRLVNNDFSDMPAEQGDTVGVFIPSATTIYDVSPSAAPYQADDTTPVKVPIALDQWKHGGFYLTDKQAGDVVAGFKPRQFESVVAGLANTVNLYLLNLGKGIYGYTGTAGTTPFASDVTAATSARAVLNRQLAPLDNRRFVFDVNAEANALGLQQFTSAEKVGSNTAIIDGTLGRRLGFDFAMDQQVPSFTSTPLTAGAATANGAQAAGAGSTDGGRTGTVSIAKATNAAPLVAGDVFTFAGDAQTYVVLTGVTLAVGNTTVAIAPALQSAKAGGEAVTLKASRVMNMAFHRDAISFACRPLQTAAQNSMGMFSMTDPVSGLSLRCEIVRQNKQVLFDLDILFGAKLTRPELGCIVAG